MLASVLALALQAQTADAELLSPAARALVAIRDTLAPDEFLRRFEALGQAGDMSAVELLGEVYSRGWTGTPRDAPRACDYFERAAPERGDAAHNLALCFERGEGRAQDLPRARTLYRQAIANGWVQANCALGTMMVAGKGGPRDAPGGVALCRKAAEAGNANAQTDYGNYLLLGEVIPKDAAEARRWLTAAATQNQANAAFVLGQIHWFGDGTPANPAEAARWWRVAYANGRKDAAAWLARELFKRISPDGKTITDRSLVPEWIRWLKAAAAEDPDPGKREEFARIVKSLETPE